MVPLKFAMRTMQVAGNVCARIYREKARDKMEHPELTPALTPTVRTPQCRRTLWGKQTLLTNCDTILLIISIYIYIYVVLYVISIYVYICLFMVIYDYIWLHMIICDYILLYMIIYDYIWLYMIILLVIYTWFMIGNTSIIVEKQLHFLFVPEVFIPHWLGVPLGLGDGFHFPTLIIYFINCLSLFIYIYYII